MGDEVDHPALQGFWGTQTSLCVCVLCVGYTARGAAADGQGAAAGGRHGPRAEQVVQPDGRDVVPRDQCR
jgi:hypothetical protein